MMTSIVLAGCGGGEEAPKVNSPKEVDPAIEAQKVIDTPVELIVTYPNAGEELFNKRMGDPIRKKFPKFTIKYIPTTSKDFADVQATLPNLDLIFASASTMPLYLLDYKLESDISDLIKKYKYDISRLVPSTLDVQRRLGNGALYGLPWALGTNIFLYNKDLFNKFGVPYPKDGMTWDELYSLAGRMTRTDGGVAYQGLTMIFTQIMTMNQLTAPYFDPKTFKAKFTDDVFKRQFENAGRFFKMPGNEPSNRKFTEGGVRDLFTKAQTSAMHLDVLGGLGIAAQNMTSSSWDLATFPVYADKPKVGPSSLPDYAFLTSKSKNRDAAFQVLSYLTSDEFQEYSANVTAAIPPIHNPEKAMKSFGGSIPGIEGKNIKAIIANPFADMQGITPYNSNGATQMVTAINDYMAGKDVNTVLREAAERADKIIAEEQAKSR